MARHLWGMDTGDRNSIRAGAVQDRKGGAKAVAQAARRDPVRFRPDRIAQALCPLDGPFAYNYSD